jgi:hypothetical protein
MMKKIDAIAMVREIRDKQHKDIENKTHQEIIEYFREKANGLKDNAAHLKQTRKINLSSDYESI